MGLFTRRDRIAIVCFAFLIVVGWMVRLILDKRHEPGELRFIKNAVTLPPSLVPSDSLSIIYVNINTASESELATLPSIGAVKAEAIISYRTRNGLFSQTEEIMNVPGIGKKTFERIKEHIMVTSPED